MARSSKPLSPNLEWKKCQKCTVMLHKQDNKRHVCFNLFDWKSDTLIHGFVLEDTFYAKIDKPKGSTFLPRHISPLVLLNPSTMQLLNLAKGGCAILGKHCNDDQVFHCWPCSSVAASSLVIPLKSKIKSKWKNWVSVQPFLLSGKPIRLAAEVVLSTKQWSHFMSTKEFKDFLLLEYGNYVIQQEMIFDFHYLGTHVEARLKKIAGCLAREVHKDCQNEDMVEQEVVVDLICENYSNLSLNDEPVSKTPQRSSLNCSFTSDSKPQLSSDLHILKKCSTPLSNVNRKSSSESIFGVSLAKENVKTVFESYFKIGPKTKFHIEHHTETKGNSGKQRITFANICGLDQQIELLRSLLPSFLPLNTNINDMNTAKGIFMCGPSGTGKSLLVQALCNESQVPCILFNCSDIFSKATGGALSSLIEVFFNAMEKAPCILVLEDVDAIYHKDNNSKLSTEDKDIMDELPKLVENIVNLERNAVVIATTNKPDVIDSGLRRPGRLEREILFKIPESDERKKILSKLLETKCHNLTQQQIDDIANSAHGLSSSDILAFCHKAYLKALINRNEDQGDNLGDVQISHDDLHNSMREIQPFRKEFTFEIPKVYWHEVGGMHQIKEKIMDMVDLPLKHPDKFVASGVSPPNGVLMYGPPGCSKTMIAKALATESHLNFISIKGPELFSKWVGESERAIKDLFERAKASAPCIIFFDEIDSLAAERRSGAAGSNVGERVLTQLMAEMDGINVLKGVSIIAATNRPDLIDPGLLRTGRFDSILYVPLPDSATREEIFNIKLSKMPIEDDIDIKHLVEITEGYTGAEISAICQESAMLVISEDVSSSSSRITMSHIRHSLSVMKPRTSQELIQFYENYKNKYKARY